LCPYGDNSLAFFLRIREMRIVGIFPQTESEERFGHLLKKHPCFNGEAHFQYGRIHLPVSPNCNIQCRFCKRGFNKWEKRPGVSRVLLAPREAAWWNGPWNSARS